MSFITDILYSPNTITAFKIVYYTAPFWLAPILGSVLFNIFLMRQRAKHFAKQTYVLLEIKIPKEVFKSPQAMEFLFTALYQTFGEVKFEAKWDRWPPKFTYDYWKGSVRNFFSFEICAIDGRVHFFIWTKAGLRGLIESQLYSQYEGIEIYEVPDYTLPISYDKEKMGFWCREFVLTKADPFPIKTYVDYGLDKDPDHEYRIDPLLPLVEFLGSLPPAHQIWIQIVITAHKATDRVRDEKTGEVKDVDLKWDKAAKEEIQKILDKAKPPKPKEGEQAQSSPRSLTESEKDTISALDRSISKKGFDTGIRAIYFAPKDVYVEGNNGGIMSGMTHFNSSLNGLKPKKVVDLDKEKEHILDAYKNRGYFYNEYKAPTFVLNTEELATLFHLPPGVTTTPALERIGSKKSQAPANLPL